MKLEEAKRICPDADFIRRADQSVACRHRFDVNMDLEEKSNLCVHPQHFLCELVLYQIRKKASEATLPAMSLSRANAIDACARKYAFSYVYKVGYATKTPVYFRTGDAFGVGRAKLDAGIPFDITRVRPDIPPQDRAIVKAVLRFYAAHPPYPLGEMRCEEPFEIDAFGHRWVGFLDALAPDENIVEWKYAKEPYDLLKAIRQASIYLLAFPKARHVEWIRFKKPGHRKNAKENWAGFEERVFDDLMKKGDDNYERLMVRRRDFDPEKIVEQMAARPKMLPLYEQHYWPPSYGRDCGMCDYSGACSAHPSKPTDLLANMIASGEIKL